MTKKRLKITVLKATPRVTNLAHSLYGYLWAISSLATEKITNSMYAKVTCGYHQTTSPNYRCRKQV